MSSGLSSGVSGLALGTGLYRDVSGLWGGASGLIAGFGGWTPAVLFAQGEPGGWYDPSDLSTMFQDSAGTTPVTATGQTVGRILDKSGRGNHLTQANLANRAQYQIDSNGNPFLLFDGSDDFYISPTITPGIDKAQVFAGVRKLSDAGSGLVAETSISIATNNGAIRLSAPFGAAANYAFQTKGVAESQALSSNSFAAPVTNVLTGIGDIAADVALLRVNGTQVATSSTDQGTGNYLAYPLYVGRRGGTTLPFNGRLYQLIVRFGANLPLATIQQAESYTNSKTGAY